MLVKFRAPQEAMVIDNMYELTFEYFDFKHPFEHKHIVVSIGERNAIVTHNFIRIRIGTSALVMPDVHLEYLGTDKRIRNEKVIRGAYLGVRCKREVSIHSKEVQDAIECLKSRDQTEMPDESISRASSSCYPRIAPVSVGYGHRG